MSNLPRISIDDTLSLIQLFRETALAKGREAQAQKLSPVMEEMQQLAATAKKDQSTVPPSKGMLEQTDFKKMLEVTQGKPQNDPASSSSPESALERNRLIQAMAGADMSEVEIARQFGMSRDEVRLVLSIQQKGKH